MSEELQVGHCSYGFEKDPLDGKMIADPQMIYRALARIKELETERNNALERIKDHNKECDDTCKLWRENKTCSHHGYERQCPECPNDWKIE